MFKGYCQGGVKSTPHKEIKARALQLPCNQSEIKRRHWLHTGSASAFGWESCSVNAVKDARCRVRTQLMSWRLANMMALRWDREICWQILINDSYWELKKLRAWFIMIKLFAFKFFLRHSYQQVPLCCALYMVLLNGSSVVSFCILSPVTLESTRSIISLPNFVDFLPNALMNFRMREMSRDKPSL